jgi:MerR family redox-sensitive transcriptional activator SoxR
MSDIPAMLSVGEIARRSGVAVSTLHFYEAKGLIAAERSGGNQRRFRRGVLRRVAVIKVAQRTGIPLGEIKLALDTLPADRPVSGEDWRRMSAAWRDDLDHRIAQLTALRDLLGWCLGWGCLWRLFGRVRNPADRLVL